MRIIAIGDTHGRSDWKAIVNNEQFDKIIFIGDYFDSFNIKGEDQINNFLDIIQYKKSNPEKVILLIGNHDYHYHRSCPERYSGYQSLLYATIGEVLHSAMDQGLMKMCHIEGKYLLTHAGVTNTWAKKYSIDKNNLDGSINDLFTYKPQSFRFQGHDMYGNDKTQSPIWVRPDSLLTDRLPEYIHVVGHTQAPKLRIVSDQAIFIDCMEYSKEYLIIENEVTSIGQINTI